MEENHEKEEDHQRESRTIRDVRVTVAGWTAGGILEGDGHSRPA